MPTTIGAIEPRTKIVGANHTDVQISANPWNQPRIITGGSTGGLFVRDTTQPDGWGLLDAAAGVLRCSGAGALPAWSNDGAGLWTPVAYSAANFVGTGSMVWTVDAGDQVRFSYQLNAKTLTVSFWINTSSLTGTASNEIRLTIPAGKTSAAYAAGIVWLNNPTSNVGIINAPASQTYLQIYKADQSNYTLSTNTFLLSGTFTFEVN
jgi:hypothetical protein